VTAAENLRLVSLNAGTASAYDNHQKLSYNYDDVGNVLTIADAAAFGGSQTQSFSYDALDRLATAQATGGSHGAYAQRSYQYNNAGNPSSGSGQVLTSFEGSAYAYHDADHKHGVTHIGGVQKYWGACPERSRRDANGNVTRRIAPWGTDITLAYDAENRLTQVSGGVTASYTYDGDGVRVKAVVGATTSVYVGAYYEVTGGVVKKYYYAGNVRVAENNGGTLHFLLTDHLGSTATTTDANGNRVTELRYYPYGDSERYNPGGQITTYRFTGQRWDPGTGLYWYNSRWYDPLIGRFIQADTIVPQPGNPQALNSSTMLD
jgi:RHS repeat-associated protein